MNTLVSLSGGMDSAVTLKWAILRHGRENVSAAHFSYGSKHSPYEKEMAFKQAALQGIAPPLVINLEETFSHFRSDLLRSGGDIPEGHYNDESMRRTVVPCRNMILASILAGIADSNGIQYVCLGIHAGDHHIYPDCRPDFFEDFKETTLKATENRVLMQAPWLVSTKLDVLRYGLANGVQFEHTRTCYKDQPFACGVCGSCRERLEAFGLLGMRDPATYSSQGVQTTAPFLG